MGTRASLRTGSLTTTEKNLITQVALDQPGEMRPAQVTALAKALRRSKEAVKGAIEDARDKFRENADFYVDVHKQATALALATGSVGGMEIAQKGAQWAIERITAEGVGLIEKKAQEGSGNGPRVLIGIRIGGIDATKTLDATAVTVE